jgi:hypothetical protein
MPFIISTNGNVLWRLCSDIFFTPINKKSYLGRRRSAASTTAHRAAQVPGHQLACTFS